mmetsp:Transcript_8285/g.25599  ORF Transcript_8285/g.25599 Transcript_8285/m.25599 type:complete len:455 (+) Transcript_8285:71-1435(+)
MATSHPAERLRAFFAEKRREVYFRAQRELEDEATKKKTAKTKKFCVAEEEAKYSEANLGRCLGFVKELEAKFAGDATTASAFVDLMRAFLTRGSLEEVAGVAVALFDGELLESFASIVGSTADDIRTLHEAKPQQQKKRGRKPSDKSSPGGGAPASKKLKKTSSSKVTWRVDEDERMGSFFLHEGERSLEAVARVDAWSLKEESEERSYRGTLLLGARQGTLVEVTGLPQHLSDDLVTVLKLCEPLPSSWNETLRGGSSSIFRTAAKKTRPGPQTGPRVDRQVRPRRVGPGQGHRAAVARDHPRPARLRGRRSARQSQQPRGQEARRPLLRLAPRLQPRLRPRQQTLSLRVRHRALRPRLTHQAPELSQQLPRGLPPRRGRRQPQRQKPNKAPRPRRRRPRHLRRRPHRLPLQRPPQRRRRLHVRHLRPVLRRRQGRHPLLPRRRRLGLPPFFF